MFFSIIIPAYNAASYIKRCIDSVIIQDFSDFEIIIIDDGSTDDTFQYINATYSHIDNIIVYKQNNSGVSVARNHGLKKSTGKYVVFLDSDDWIENGYLSYLYNILSSKDYDGIVLGFIKDDGTKLNYISYFKNEEEISNITYRQLFIDGVISNNPWDKVFKRSIYELNSIRFPKNIKIGEDAVVSASFGLFAKNVYLSKKSFVHYMQNSNGVTKRAINISHLSDLHFALDSIIKMYSKYCDKSDLSKMYMYKMYNLIRNVKYSTFSESLIYSEYNKHIGNIKFYSFKNRNDLLVKFPLFILSKINLLPFYYRYEQLLNYVKKFVSLKTK